MTADEKDWLTSVCPASMFYTTEHLPNRRAVRSARRLRLYSCGCYTIIWDRIKMQGIKDVIIKTEEWADGKITKEDLRPYRYPKGESRHGSPDWYLKLSIGSLITPHVIPAYMAYLTRSAIDPAKYERAGKWADCPPQADLVREVFGNPFRPVKFPKGCRTNTAVQIARQMYDERDFSATPILADALEDAGCDSADVLTHLRSPGPHVRGCWAVDLVLGKK
jgi:hypothetical protein